MIKFIKNIYINKKLRLFKYEIGLKPIQKIKLTQQYHKYINHKILNSDASALTFLPLNPSNSLFPQLLSFQSTFLKFAKR